MKIKKYYVKMPGSSRQRNRARHLLKCDKVGLNTWVVSGGENAHTVKIGSLGGYECDCRVYRIEEKLCSHIIKVRMERNDFPSEPVLVPVAAR